MNYQVSCHLLFLTQFSATVCRGEKFLFSEAMCNDEKEAFLCTKLCMLYQHINWQQFKQIHGLWLRADMLENNNSVKKIDLGYLILSFTLRNVVMSACLPSVLSLWWHLTVCLQRSEIKFAVLFLRIYHRHTCESLILCKFFWRTKVLLKLWKFEVTYGRVWSLVYPCTCWAKYGLDPASPEMNDLVYNFIYYQ